MFKTFLLTVFIIGIMMMVMDMNKNNVCTQPKTIYKFIPRTFQEELSLSPQASDVFRTMFKQPDPWIESIDNLTMSKREDINQFFITQM
jgi:hypothetical protein